MKGFETQIHCDYDNTNHFCKMGTEGCADNHQPYCVPPNKTGLAQTEIILFAQTQDKDGGKSTVTCDDGSVRACYIGTRKGCDKEEVCDGSVGYET